MREEGEERFFMTHFTAYGIEVTWTTKGKEWRNRKGVKISKPNAGT